MARRAQSLRLSRLQPGAVATEAVRLISNRAISLTAHVQGSAWTLDGSTLALEVSALVCFAQVGRGSRPEQERALMRLCDSLYRRALDGAQLDDRAGFIRDAADPRGPLGLIALAALARVELAEERELSAECLACLASVSADHVRLLTRRGGLVSSPRSSPRRTRYGPAVAREYLRQRRVPGVAPPWAVGDRVCVPRYDASGLRLFAAPQDRPKALEGRHGRVLERLGARLRVELEDGPRVELSPRFLAPAPVAASEPLC